MGLFENHKSYQLLDLYKYGHPKHYSFSRVKISKKTADKGFNVQPLYLSSLAHLEPHY